MGGVKPLSPRVVFIAPKLPACSFYLVLTYGGPIYTAHKKKNIEFAIIPAVYEERRRNASVNHAAARVSHSFRKFAVQTRHMLRQRVPTIFFV